MLDEVDTKPQKYNKMNESKLNYLMVGTLKVVSLKGWNKCW